MGHYSAEQNAALYPITPARWFGRDALHRHNFAAVRDVIGSSVTKTVLDWGCGNLLWSLGLFPGADFTGVELSDETLHYAAINAEAAGATFRGVLVTDADRLPSDHFDVACAIALIELLSPAQFDQTFSTVHRALKNRGTLLVTFHNWRQFSALYLPFLWRGGYEGYCARLGSRISRKSHDEVLGDFRRLGYSVVRSGAYNPYPSKVWRYIKSMRLYRTDNRLLRDWYCSHYAVLEKRF